MSCAKQVINFILNLESHAASSFNKSIWSEETETLLPISNWIRRIEHIFLGDIIYKGPPYVL